MFWIGAVVGFFVGVIVAFLIFVFGVIAEMVKQEDKKLNAGRIEP